MTCQCLLIGCHPQSLQTCRLCGQLRGQLRRGRRSGGGCNLQPATQRRTAGLGGGLSAPQGGGTCMCCSLRTLRPEGMKQMGGGAGGRCGRRGVAGTRAGRHAKAKGCGWPAHHSRRARPQSVSQTWQPGQPRGARAATCSIQRGRHATRPCARARRAAWRVAAHQPAGGRGFSPPALPRAELIARPEAPGGAMQVCLRGAARPARPQRGACHAVRAA